MRESRPRSTQTTVKFYLNRYRAVVWLYLAEELRRFRADLSSLFLLVNGCFVTLAAR